MKEEIKPFPGEVRRTWRGVFFTRNQLEWFKGVYPNHTNKEIARVLGISEKAISEKGRRLKLRKVDGHFGEAMRRLVADDKHRREIGLKPKSRRNLCHYTNSQWNFRYRMKKLNYILGDWDERWGERFTIYYDEHTERRPIREANAAMHGFRILPLPEEEPEYNYKFQ